MAKGKRKLIFYIFVFIVTIGTFYIIFNEYGALKYMDLKNEVDSMKAELEKTKSENDFKDILAKIVIGADGFECNIGRWAGIRKKWEEKI